MRELLTVFDVAQRVRAHPETVRRWVRAGQLPAVKLGRKVLIDPAELERVLRAGLGAAATPSPSPAPTYEGAAQFPATLRDVREVAPDLHQLSGNRAGGDAGDGWELPLKTRTPRIIG